MEEKMQTIQDEATVSNRRQRESPVEKMILDQTSR